MKNQYYYKEKKEPLIYLDESLTLHREDGPAITEYSKKGDELILQKWFKDGKLHREDGPAFIFYMFEGYGINEWWIDGRKIK